MKTQTKTRGVFAALALTGLLVIGGCDAQATDSSEQLASLTKEVKESQRLNQALLDRIDRLERTIDGHTQDIDVLSRDVLSRGRVAKELAAAEVAPTDEGVDEALAATTVASSDIAKMLESEDGRAAVEKAMAAVQEKRDAERRERWVGAMVDRFAADANLTAPQTEDMRRITASSFKKIGELWSGMRGGDATPEERAMQREEAMIKMAEIRQETNDEVKAVLSTDQYAIYEEQMSRMRGGFGGGGRRGGGGGR
jgi:chromosome segregation ATPase